jgi:acetylornithine deacetylase/succinyl-diaminopimelate desuccinylase-like protein
MPGKTREQVSAALQSLCERLAGQSGLTFQFSLEAAREPFETPAHHPVVRAFDVAARRMTGSPVKQIGMALVGDGNLFANEAGVAAVYYGPAHETAHSDHEKVSAARLAHCAKVYALAALEFCGQA